jgi:hypothetical protein
VVVSGNDAAGFGRRQGYDGLQEDEMTLFV